MSGSFHAVRGIGDQWAGEGEAIETSRVARGPWGDGIAGGILKGVPVCILCLILIRKLVRRGHRFGSCCDFLSIGRETKRLGVARNEVESDAECTVDGAALKHGTAGRDFKSGAVKVTGGIAAVGMENINRPGRSDGLINDGAGIGGNLLIGMEGERVGIQIKLGGGVITPEPGMVWSQ